MIIYIIKDLPPVPDKFPPAPLLTYQLLTSHNAVGEKRFLAGRGTFSIPNFYKSRSCPQHAIHPSFSLADGDKCDLKSPKRLNALCRLRDSPRSAPFAESPTKDLFTTRCFYEGVDALHAQFRIEATLWMNTISLPRCSSLRAAAISRCARSRTCT